MKQFWFVSGLMLAYATPIFPCSCVSPPPGLNTHLAVAEWRFKQAPVIFEGRVEKLELQGWPLRPQPGKTVSVKPGIRAEFSGVHFYEGTTKKDFVVETGLGGGDCGYRFETGESYLVYAWIEETGNLSTGICSGTTPLDYAGTALRLLHGDPPTLQDLADLRGGEKKPSVNAGDSDRLCGKVSFPQGSRPRPVSISFWRANGDPNPLPLDSVDTETDGSFCSHDLDPGSYVLEAMEDAESSSDPKYGYSSYYPGVKDRAQAEAVLVKREGGNEHVVFPVLRQPLHSVKGYLRGVPQGDNQAVLIMMTSRADPMPRTEPVPLGPHGVFEIRGVPSGKYSVFAFRADEEEDRITFVSEVVDLDLKDDVVGVKLQFLSNQ